MYVLFGIIKAITGADFGVLMWGFSSCMIFLLRKNMRQKFMIAGSDIEDGCVSIWCQCCALSQVVGVSVRLSDTCCVCCIDVD